MTSTGTIADPICGHCGRPVVGLATWGASGAPYHPECCQGPHVAAADFAALRRRVEALERLLPASQPSPPPGATQDTEIRAILHRLLELGYYDAAPSVPAGEVETPMSESVNNANDARLEGLRYALRMVQGRRILNRTRAYMAAVDEMEIFLEAAIERVERGKPMDVACEVESPAR